MIVINILRVTLVSTPLLYIMIFLLFSRAYTIEYPHLSPGMKYVFTIQIDIEINRTRNKYNFTYDTEKFFTIPENITFGGNYYRLIRLDSKTFVNLPIIKINGGENLESIGEGSMASNKNLTIIDFSKTKLNKIEDNAFEDCPKLCTIILPSTLSYIGSGIFKDTGVRNVDFSETLIGNISSRAFLNCLNLSSVKIPPTCKALLDSAFHYSTIETIEGLQYIDFFGPYSLCETKRFVQVIDLSKSKKNIEILDGAFMGCGSPEIILADNVECIRKFGFKLTNFGNFLRPSKSLEYVETEAFCNCHNIKSVDLSLTKLRFIPNGCFSGCININFIIFPSSVIEIGDSAFYGCSSIQSIRIPFQVEVLGRFSLSHMDSISVLDLSDTNITIIPSNAFVYDKSLSVIYFPSNLNLVMKGAMFNCPSIVEVYFEAVNDIGQPVFDSGLSKLRIHVPSNYDGDTLFGYKVVKDIPAIIAPSLKPFEPTELRTKTTIPSPAKKLYYEDIEEIDEEEEEGYLQIPIPAVANAVAFVLILILVNTVFLVYERMEKNHSVQNEMEDVIIDEIQ